MNIFYIHGFGSRFTLESSKIQALQNLGTVRGVDWPTCANKEDAYNFLLEAMYADITPSVIIGTSLGGYHAWLLGSRVGIPHVSINPCTKPHEMLRKHIGSGKDHYGRSFNLKAENVETYSEMNCSEGYGLYLVDEADDVIPSNSLMELQNAPSSIIMFPNGSHRFDHMEESLPIIRKFVTQSTSWGLSEGD